MTRETGVFAPVTQSGKIVVDGVLFSCYSGIESEQVVALFYNLILALSHLSSYVADSMPGLLFQVATGGLSVISWSWGFFVFTLSFDVRTGDWILRCTMLLHYIMHSILCYKDHLKSGLSFLLFFFFKIQLSFRHVSQQSQKFNYCWINFERNYFFSVFINSIKVSKVQFRKFKPKISLLCCSYFKDK